MNTKLNTSRSIGRVEGPSCSVVTAPSRRKHQLRISIGNSGAVAPIMLDIVIGHPSKASEGRATVHRDTLFPAWWPLDQFRKSTETK